jgi:hypothetical protein
MKIQSLFFFVIVVALVLGASSADARIGETLEECQKRYGPVIRSTHLETEFTRNNVAVRVKFFRGKVSEIRYTNSEAPFNDKEVHELLRVNHPYYDEKSGIEPWVLERSTGGIQSFKGTHIEATHIKTYRSSSLLIKASNDYFKDDLSGIKGF